MPFEGPSLTSTRKWAAVTSKHGYLEAVYQECLEKELRLKNATGFQLGLIVNFGHHPKVQIQRFAQ